MFASTAGGGAMSLVFKPRKSLKKGTVTSVKVPNLSGGRARRRSNNNMPPQGKL